MNKGKNWWKRNWKWLASLSVISVAIILLINSEFGKISSDLINTYSDTELYENALNKVKTNEQVIKIIGKIAPIDRMAIIEGNTEYSNNYQTVKSTIRIIGTKEKALMDIIANKMNGIWNYSKITIRIKKPIEKKQIIEIIPI